MRQRHAQRLADHLRRRRGAQELAAAAGRGAGAAAQASAASSQRDLAVREARADRICTLPASSPSFGEQRDAARHQHAGQIVHRRPAPSSSPAGPCRRWPRRARRCAWAASGSAGGTRWPRRCDRAGCRTCRSCPACGRRRDRCSTPANGIAPSALQFLGGGLHQQADFPVAGVIAERDRRAVGGADAAVRAQDQEFLAAERARDPSPCRRSGVQPNRSPEGRCSSISGVIGSEPCGPGALLRTSKREGSPESRIR